MGYGIRLEVWGDYALFCRSEMKVERVSYDVITPLSLIHISWRVFCWLFCFRPPSNF